MDKTLVILAAGMGSRFGGLKQVEEVGPGGEFILDYSVYDAIDAGFNKVVFVIKKENYEFFKNTVGKRLDGKIKIEYVFQDNKILPFECEILQNRKKPLGTAHAIYSCKDVVKEPFMIINADDFYGKDSYIKGMEFLVNRLDNNYGLITYELKNTITELGEYKRGICFSENGFLVKLVESRVEMKNGEILIKPFDKKLSSYVASENELVSMGMLILDSNIFKYIEEKLVEYYKKNIDNLENYEFLLPDILSDGICDGKFRCEIIKTDAVWMGITYKEEVDSFKKSINLLVENGIYPKKLFKKN